MKNLKPVLSANKILRYAQNDIYGTTFSVISTVLGLLGGRKNLLCSPLNT